jgi:nucleotide-binding universal stress UspA family protein
VSRCQSLIETDNEGDVLTTTSKIVVGIDGSKESRLALRWALEEAKLRGATLRVVHTWSLPHTGAGPGTAMQPQALTQAIDDDRVAAADLIDSELAAAGIDRGGVTIEPVVVEGPAASALLAESESAELIVVGSRGRGGFKGLLLGSVSHQTAQHASCPVVIVRHDSAPTSES